MPGRLVRIAGLGALALVGVATGSRSALAQPSPRPMTRVWVDPVLDVAPDARAAVISNILYVNRCVGGCTLTPGNNDARANSSSIIDGTVTLTEFTMGDAAYDEIVECLRDVYSPYDVEIVTEDPGDSEFHHEAILAGTPEELGLDPNVGGIAPASCEPLNNVISFSFGNLEGTDPETLCWTLAQESAHSFGLPNHVYDCLDPMTYLPGPCGRKYFRNRGIECGEFEPTECVCGVDDQNSHVELLATFGPGTPPAPPVVDILYPEPDAAVEDDFTVFFTALDPHLVSRVEVYVNGAAVANPLPGHNFQSREDDYNIRTGELPDGILDVEVRAYNDINQQAGTALVTVTKGEPCTSADQCFEFMECSEGRCLYPEAAGELGDECGYDQYCLEGRCAEADGERLCSQSCNPLIEGVCPSGFECLSGGFCWPSEGEGGCCAVAGGQGRQESFPLVALSLFAGAVLIVRRGIRRKATGPRA